MTHSFEITLTGTVWFENLCDAFLPLGFCLDSKSVESSCVEFLKKHNLPPRIRGQYQEIASVTEKFIVDVMTFPDCVEYLVAFSCDEMCSSSHVSGLYGGVSGGSMGHKRLARSYRSLDEAKEDLPDLVRRGRWKICLDLQKDHVCEALYGVDLAEFMARRDELFDRGLDV